MPLPFSIYDGRPHAVQIVARDGRKCHQLIGGDLLVTLDSGELIDGHVSLGADGVIHGWAVDISRPNETLEVRIVAANRGSLDVMADRHVPGLQEAGLGSGHHGFQLVIPPAWYEAAPLEIVVTENATGRVLNGAPLLLLSQGSYWSWIKHTSAKADGLRARLSRQLARAARRPTLAVLMPVYNPQVRLLHEAISSVRAQSYADWQLCVADDASTDPEVVDLLQDAAASDRRISLVRRAKNGHISAASNSAFELVRSDFVVLLDHDDLLHPDALLHVAHAALEHPRAGVIFSDEDKCDAHGIRYGPYFKPGWNRELLLGQNCVSHLGAYRTDLVRRVGGFRRGYEGSQDYDLALRVTRLLKDDQIVHIPQMLYHWRAIPGSTALANTEKEYARRAMRKALKSHLRAVDEKGRVVDCGSTFFRFVPSLPDPMPRVSVLVDGVSDRSARLAVLSEILSCARLDVEVLVGRDTERARPTQDGVRSVAIPPGAHESTRFDLLARAASGNLLVWLAQGVFPRQPASKWLPELVGQASRRGVGIVAPKIVDANSTIVTAGCTVAADARGRRLVHHHLAGLAQDELGEAGLAQLSRAVPAVSGHVFAIRRELARPRSAGPPSETRQWTLALCERARASGAAVLVTPAICFALPRKLAPVNTAPSWISAGRLRNRAKGVA